MKHLPVFTITLTAICLVAFIAVVVERRDARLSTDVYVWDVSGPNEKVAVGPDMSAMHEPVDLFVLVRGEDVFDRWEWQATSALIVRITEYGSVMARDTAWCKPLRLRHWVLADAQACQLQLAWTPGVSESIHISGTLSDLPSGYTTELVAVPRGYYRRQKRARDWAWLLGIAYLLGSSMIVKKIRHSRIGGAP